MRVLFAGTGDIGIPTLRYLHARHCLIGLLTQPDCPAGRRRELKLPPIKEELERLDSSVPVLQPESPRDPGVLEWVQALGPELIVTMAYGRILPGDLLSAPTLACLNIHASLLPRHRGASPIQAAIEAGDSETGVTIMHMARGLDTGDVILEQRIPIRRRETAGSLSGRLSVLAPEALDQAIGLLDRGEAPRIPQNDALATITGKISREDTLLDWFRPAIELERRIRALQPRPAAYAMLPLRDGSSVSLKIHSAIVCRRCTGKPGTIIRNDRRGLLVGCGVGGLLLGSVQPEGGARMHSSAFARGHALAFPA